MFSAMDCMQSPGWTAAQFPAPRHIVHSNLRRPDGQGENELRPMALIALDPNTAAVCLYGCAAEGQPNAQTAWPVRPCADSGELVKDPLLFRGRNTRPLVL